MTWTPYGSPPASMQSKAWRTMTPQEAYERATPDQRRRWFGNERPVKSVGTTPPHDPGEDLALQRAIASGQEAQRLGYGYDDPVNGNVCAQCRSAAPTETKGGRCRHRPGRAELVQQRDWQRRAEQNALFQQAQQHRGAGPSALVVDWTRETEVQSLKAEILAFLETI